MNDTEAPLSQGLVRDLRQLPGSMVIKHADHLTCGVPDISVTWHGRTTWLEVKRVKNGRVIQRGLQHYTMRKMAQQGSAFYVYYTDEETQVLDPETMEILVSCSGHNHELVVSFVRRMHS